MKKILLLTSVLLAFGGAAVLNASDSPDSNKYHLTTVKWVEGIQNGLDNDNKYVVLEGKVTQKHDSDTYFFTDGTGSIELDSDIELPVGVPIIIRGEVDQAFLHIGPLEINVESWRHDTKK